MDVWLSLFTFPTCLASQQSAASQRRDELTPSYGQRREKLTAALAFISSSFPSGRLPPKRCPPAWQRWWRSPKAPGDPQAELRRGSRGGTGGHGQGERAAAGCGVSRAGRLAPVVLLPRLVWFVQPTSKLLSLKRVLPESDRH